MNDTNTPKYVTLAVGTDRYAFEVVGATAKTLKVRELNATLTEDSKPECHVGGFAAHVSNNHSLRYDFTSNPKNPVLRIWATKKPGIYSGKMGKFRVTEKPVYFYDYNF